MTDANTAAENPNTDEIFQKEMFPNVAANPNNSDQKQTDLTDGKAGQKTGQIVPKGEGPNKRYSQTKKAKGKIAKDATQPKKPKTEDMVKWSVFVQEETKTAIGKAVDKAGITVTEWVDTRLRKAANDELSRKPQPPAKVEDVADIIKGFAETMQASQQAAQEQQTAALNAQSDLIKQQGEQIAALSQTVEKNQPKSLRDMFFGKKKID